MREIKFRAWGKHLINHQSDYAWAKAHEKFDLSEPENRMTDEWDKWNEDFELYRNIMLDDWNKKHEQSEHHSEELMMLDNTLFSIGDKLSVRAFYEVIEVMQYTGLKDSASVEIYEGDIVSCMGGYEDGFSELPGEIQFLDGQWFVISAGDSTPLWEFDLNRVIGNIYESPELLTR